MRGRGIGFLPSCRGRSPSVWKRRGADSWKERLPILCCLGGAARGAAARRGPGAPPSAFEDQHSRSTRSSTAPAPMSPTLAARPTASSAPRLL